MGIFVNALREETEFLDNTGFYGGAVANPDDKYEVELNDVAKAVEDINQNYADQSSQEELDGQDLKEDPVAECMIAIYESEHNWNQIMNALATKEVHEAAMGRELVLESVDVKGFFEKVKQFFVTLWKKITAVVKNWLENASAVLRTNKSFVSKYGSKLDEGKTAYFADSKNKAFKGYNFPNDLKTGAANMTKGFKAMDTGAANTMINDAIKALRSGQKITSEDVADLEKVNQILDALREAFCGKDVGASEYRKAVKVAFFGSEEKVTLDENAIVLKPDYIKGVLSSDMKMKEVKSAYADMKKSINNSIKAINEMEKAIKNSYKGGEASEATSAALTMCSKCSSFMKDAKNIAHMCMTTFMKSAHAQAAQARRIGNSYIFALNKKTRNGKIDAANGKPTHESAGFFGSLDLI